MSHSVIKANILRAAYEKQENYYIEKLLALKKERIKKMMTIPHITHMGWFRKKKSVFTQIKATARWDDKRTTDLQTNGYFKYYDHLPQIYRDCVQQAKKNVAVMKILKDKDVFLSLREISHIKDYL